MQGAESRPAPGKVSRVAEPARQWHESLRSIPALKSTAAHSAPSGVILPRKPLRPEVLVAIIRMTGNLRLLDRLLAQIEWVLKVNEAPEVTLEIVEAARESLVIGQA